LRTPDTARAQQASRPSGASRAFAPLVVLTSLFFMWGLITSLNDILVPHLKSAFALNYTRAMLIQFCFFGAYFVMSLPWGRFVEVRGYKQGIIVGLLIASLGCLLFYPAAGLRIYPLFLGALFVLACGITLLQVAANPYVTELGPPETASSRLTLTQAFNSLGTTLGPYLGSVFILAGTGRGTAADARVVQHPYMVLALVLGVIALLIALSPLPAIKESTPDGDARSAPSLWHERHLVLGALAIFLYVGGEVAIGSLLVNFMGQKQIADLAPEIAGKYVSLYWGGAMLGRFVGSALMTRVRPPRVLAFNAVAVAILIVTAMSAHGHVAMWALLGIGLFNSIMFPTIFALALQGLGPRTGEGSGVLCMAIVGGAVVPELQSMLADVDAIGLTGSLVAPFLCYLYIAFYGLKGYRRRPESA
jgi:MFS transporter, FHS family, L-fucose permease